MNATSVLTAHLCLSCSLHVTTIQTCTVNMFVLFFIVDHLRMHPYTIQFGITCPNFVKAEAQCVCSPVPCLLAQCCFIHVVSSSSSDSLHCCMHSTVCLCQMYLSILPTMDSECFQDGATVNHTAMCILRSQCT